MTQWNSRIWLSQAWWYRLQKAIVKLSNKCGLVFNNCTVASSLNTSLWLRVRQSNSFKYKNNDSHYNHNHVSKFHNKPEQLNSIHRIINQLITLRAFFNFIVRATTTKYAFKRKEDQNYIYACIRNQESELLQ